MRKRTSEPGLQRALQARSGSSHSIRAMFAWLAPRARACVLPLLSTLALSGLITVMMAPAQAGARGPSVSATLASLKGSGAITEAQYAQYTSAYAAAQRSLKKLSGTRHSELQSVIANVEGIAAAGEFTPTRLPALMLTLERNRQWWTTEPLIASRERVSFPPSKIVWEYYAGQGIQIQWLGTFGEANGYYLSGHENTNLRELLSEVIPLATQRAGGIAWEYMFHFDGGAPPWTSGLSQGTALQVLARAWSRFKEPVYLTAAQQALGIFQTAPPAGVRVKTSAGAEYAEYTYAPSDRILNGFIQAEVGLYEYTSITQDPLGLKLFEEGDAEARAEAPHYDTGAWSMYDQFGESDLNYHELLTEFLQHLCERTHKGPPLTAVAAPAPSPPRPHPHPARRGGHGASRAGPRKRAERAPPGEGAPKPPGERREPADPDRRRRNLLHDRPEIHRRPAHPPVVSLITTSLPAGARAGVQVSLSKVSAVEITIRRGGKTVWSNGATVERGKPKVLWMTPSQTGAYRSRSQRPIWRATSRPPRARSR